MNKIESKDNPAIKLVRKLNEKKWRDKENSYLIEGPTMIKEALESSVELTHILIKEGRDDLLKQYPQAIPVRSDVFKGISNTETPQDIMAIAKKISLQTRLSDGTYILLDRIQDPGNVGTIIRTADAAGLDGVISMKGTVDVFSPKVVRAASGALLRMPIVVMDDVEYLIGEVERTEKNVIACDAKGDREYTDMSTAKDAVIVVGNEGRGVDGRIIEIADETVSIPMKSDAESLNVSVAAGIIIYEWQRRRRNHAG